VQAWSLAIAHSGRPIWFTVSWSLDADHLSTWQQFANARRIDEDVECESRCTTLTDWPRITERFYDEVAWEHAAGPTVGWNDLDTLDVGTTLDTGLNETEQHAVCDDICYKPKVKPAFAKAAEFFTRYRDLTAGGFYSTLAGRKDLSDIGNVPLSTFDGPSARGPEACRAE